jgi:hypothetical protein
MPGNILENEEPQSFVVRMWREGPARWRGKISHVQGKDSRAFTRLEESTRFMAEKLPGIEVVRQDNAANARSPASWLPRRRSLRLAMAAVSVCVVAAIAVLVYPDGETGGNMVGTAQASGLDMALIFFLGAVVGGLAVSTWLRLNKKYKNL